MSDAGEENANSAGDAAGRIVLLNGTSSAGKTTLALALQHLRREPWHYIALDQYRDGMPGLFRGMNAPPGSPGHAGMNVVPVDRAGTRITEVRLGAVGHRMLRGMHRAIAAFVRAGNNAIVDDLILEPRILDDYLLALDGLAVLFVGVFCTVEALERRERSRLGRFPGTAIAHLAGVHAHGRYDLTVDTTHATPEGCAQTIAARLDEALAPGAFVELRELRALRHPLA